MISNSNLPPYPRYTIFCLSDAIQYIVYLMQYFRHCENPNRNCFIYFEIYLNKTLRTTVLMKNQNVIQCAGFHLWVHCNKLHMIHRIRKHFPMPFSDLPGISCWDSPSHFSCVRICVENWMLLLFPFYLANITNKSKMLQGWCTAKLVLTLLFLTILAVHKPCNTSGFYFYMHCLRSTLLW